MMNSPFVARPLKTGVLMRHVLAALLPGIAVYVACFGIGILLQLALATATAVLAEAAMLRARGLQLKPFLSDYSAVLTAWLLALSLPPLAPWWLVVTGTLIAIVIAKHLYGGLGNNPFNPAMIGFAALIVSFASRMGSSAWPAPLTLAQPHLSSGEQVARIFGWPLTQAWDAVASATPLDTLADHLRRGAVVGDILQQPIFGSIGGVGAEWIALGWLIGGLYLLARRLIAWQLPVGYLGGLALTAGIFQLAGFHAAVSPLFHLTTGGAMLGAFFILTDPVTAPTTPRGRLIFAALAGVLTYIIRVFGAFPDGVAFSVLIMNIATPLIDRFTQPAVFGRKHLKARA